MASATRTKPPAALKGCSPSCSWVAVHCPLATMLPFGNAVICTGTGKVRSTPFKVNRTLATPFRERLSGALAAPLSRTVTLPGTSC